MTTKPLLTSSPFSRHDIDCIRLFLHGESVFNWREIRCQSREEIDDLINVQSLDVHNTSDTSYLSRVRDEAIRYLTNRLRFPIPKVLRRATIGELISAASGRGHRQVCACSILKTMIVVHRVVADENRLTLPISDEEVIALTERKVWNVFRGALEASEVIKEFSGSQTQRDRYYTKLIAMKDSTASQIYDKLCFRIVTNNRRGIFFVIRFLARHLVPINSIVSSRSRNTLIPVDGRPLRLDELPRPFARELIKEAPPSQDLSFFKGNEFSDPGYRVIQIAAAIPIRAEGFSGHPKTQPRRSDPVITSPVEFQIVDHETDRENETSPASLSAYEERQRKTAELRLKLGILSERDEL